MTRKQMKKLAREIYECELVHSSKVSSLEEKSRAESRIIQITNQIMALTGGLETMFEIDLMVQEMTSKNED